MSFGLHDLNSKGCAIWIFLRESRVSNFIIQKGQNGQNFMGL